MATGLLDLPEEILIKILSYCIESQSILRITEVCKYFKDLVETVPHFIDKIQFKVDVNFDSENLQPFGDQYKYCIGSTRKFSSIDLKIRNKDSNQFRTDSKFLLDSLLKKHSETVKNLKLYLFTSRLELFEFASNSFLKYFSNAERVVLELRLEPLDWLYCENEEDADENLVY